MGIETAIIGSAVLGAAGSAIGASKASKAAKQAAAAQSDAAQKQVDLSREIYYDQRGLQQPYYQAGLQGMYGNSGLMNLLGFTTPGQGAGQAPANQNAFDPSQYASGNYGTSTIGQPPAAGSMDYAGYVNNYPDLMAAYSSLSPSATAHLLRTGADLNGDGTISQAEFGQAHYSADGQREGRSVNAFAASTPAQATQSTGQVGTAQPVDTGTPAATTPAPDPAEGPMTQTLRQTPGYNFLVDEAKRNLENSFAARGKLLSGSAMRALNAQTIGLADQTYQQSVNNAFNLANIGMGSAAQIQNAGSNYAANAGNAFQNMGNAAANGAYGQANAWNAGAQGVYGAAMGGLGMYGAYKNGWGS